MSDSHSKNAAHAPEQSHIGKDMKLGAIVAVGFVSLALFAGGIGWAYGLMTGREEEIRGGNIPPPPSEIGKQEIGIVDQVLFDTDHRLEIWQAENKKHLSSYGWVDRAKGIAHVPIEMAMQQVVAHPPDIAGEGVPPTARPVAPKAVPAPGAAPVPANPGGTP